MVMAWQRAACWMQSVAGYKIPTLRRPGGLNRAAAIAGVLVALFSVEHILALLRG